MVNELTCHRSWQHTTTLSLDLIFDRHRFSLTEVCLNNVAMMDKDLSMVTGLTVLEVDIEPVHVWKTAVFIVKNIYSMKHLKLGCETAHALHALVRQALNQHEDQKLAFLDQLRDDITLIEGERSLN